MAPELLWLGLAVAFLWAVTPILQKLALVDGTDKLTIVLLTGAVTMLAGGAYLAASPTRRARIVSDLGGGRIRWRTLGLIVGVALGNLLATFLFLHLLGRYEAYVVNTITYVTPAFTLVLAAMFLGEEPTAMSALGVALVIAGVACVGLGARQKR